MADSMILAGRLAGRAAIVTGGGGGLGLAIARRLAAEGASVLIADVGAGLAEQAAAGLAAGGKPARSTSPTPPARSG